MEDLFFKILNDKHKDLIEIAAKKKYMFLVPQAKYIIPNMLTRSFYDNHTFYQCEFDDKMYVNLNGRVLEIKNNQFLTFLGFKKPLKFNVVDESIREISNSYVKVLYIDNVIDELTYNQSGQSTVITKKEIIKKYNNKDDYVKYFNNLIKVHDDLKEIEPSLNELIEKLQNNYILIKNHVHTFSKYFQELGGGFRMYLFDKLSKYKTDEYNLIIYELTESLVFNKMYQFLYLNIKQFNVDEETELKIKMNNMKSDFSFSIYKLDTIFNECKFKSAINEIKRLPNFGTPFEKLVKLIMLKH